METLIMIINFLAIGMIITAPFLIYTMLKRTNITRFSICYFLMGIVLSGLMICVFAWWRDFSNIILLRYYGYNMQGVSTYELYKNVLPKNVQKVKDIEKSVMGIGCH